MKRIIDILASNNRTGWLLAIIAIKLLLFVYFSIQFSHHWDSDMLVGGIGVKTGDTPGYYSPATALAIGEGYNSACRMPGVVPLYTPLAVMFGAQAASVCMIFIQLALSIISVFILALFASSVFKSRYVFALVTLLYALSSFVSIFDHMLMSDSLSTSFFIFSVYNLQKALSQISWKRFLVAGFFLAWAVFLRQIFLVVYPAVAVLLLIHYRAHWKQMVQGGITFIFPLLFSIALWSQHTLALSGKRIFLASPIEECFSTYTLQYQELSGLLIDMGYGEPFWTESSLPQWMIRSRVDVQAPPIPERHFNSAFNADSLHALREQYRTYLSSQGKEREVLGNAFLDKTRMYREVYRKEKKLNYYFLNRLRHIRVFLFPMRLDNLPGPAYHEMNFFEKGIKLFYTAFFFVVVPLGLLSLFLLLFKRPLIEGSWAIIPIFLFGALALLLGFVEQRYFVPIYPFCIIGVAVLISSFIERAYAKAGR